MKILLILLPFLFITISGLSAQKDWYANDSTKKVGITLVDGGDLLNSKVCQLLKTGNIIRLSPYEINQYGFADGRVYVASDINVSGKLERVFLERLILGNLSLYSLKSEGLRTFFVEKDSLVLTELPEKKADELNYSFRDKIAGLTYDCPDADLAARRISYNENSVSKFVSRYNNCGSKPFPFFKIGLFAGYGATKLFFESFHKVYDKLLGPQDIQYIPLNLIEYKYKGSIALGMFIDNPIRNGSFSFHPELYFSHHSFDFTREEPGRTLRFTAKSSSLNVPLLIRYTYPSQKLKPFVNSGIYYTRNFGNQSQLVVTYTPPSDTTITNDLISNNMIGLSLGGGLEYRLESGKSMFFEIRGNRLYGSSRQNSLYKAEIQFFTGFSF